MQVEDTKPSAAIIPFVPRVGNDRFTAADRLDVLSWEARNQGGVRLAIYKRRHDDPPEVGEFASFYPPDARWAAWGAVRQGRAIRVWRSMDGRDIGRFDTMGEALAAVTKSAGKRRCR